MLKNYHPQHMSGFKWKESYSIPGWKVPILPDPPKCKCNLNAKAVIVKKECPNQGKSFWACPSPQGEQCKFFEWEDKEKEEGNNKRKSESGGSIGTNNQEESIRTVALNLLAEKISSLEQSIAEANGKVTYDAIQDARADIQNLTKLIQKFLEK